MLHRTLGRSGLSVPVLGFGTATFGGSDGFFAQWGTTGVDEARRLVDIALEAGANLFDTADSYSGGLAEEILGKAIAGRQSRVLVSTKAFYRTGEGPNGMGSSRRHLIDAVEGSLRRLGVEHIDLFQLHGFDAQTPVEETLATLDVLVRAGKIRYVGCSNFSGWHLMKSLAAADRHGWPRHIAHQAYYSLLAREFEWELMPLGLDQGVGTVVWSALSGGLLSGKIGRGRPAPKDSRIGQQGTLGPTPPDEQIHAIVDVLEAIAGELGRTVSQVAINWVLQRPTVATVIIGARDERQLRGNLAAAEFTLTAEQLARLDQASERPAAYPYWHQRGSAAERNPPPV